MGWPGTYPSGKTAWDVPFGKDGRVCARATGRDYQLAGLLDGLLAVEDDRRRLSCWGLHCRKRVAYGPGERVVSRTRS